MNLNEENRGLEKGTIIFLKIKRTEAARFNFLSAISGYVERRSHYADLDGYPDYWHYTVVYDTHLGFREKSSLIKSIKKNGGEIIDTNQIGKKPMMKEENKRMLIDSGIMGAISFLASVAGIKFISAIEVLHAVQIGLVPAIAAFFTELVIERKRRQH